MSRWFPVIRYSQKSLLRVHSHFEFGRKPTGSTIFRHYLTRILPVKVIYCTGRERERFKIYVMSQRKVFPWPKNPPEEPLLYGWEGVFPIVQSTLKGLVFAGIKFREDLILQGFPRYQILAKIRNQTNICHKKITRNEIRNINLAENWKKPAILGTRKNCEV